MRLARLCSTILALLTLLAGAYIQNGTAQEQAESQTSRKFDEFGHINCEDELARLDAFYVELQKNPNLKGYIIMYGGRRGKRNEAKARAARMKFYLVRVRGFDVRRVVTMDGGYREELSGELWLVSPNEDDPLPTPTVKAKDVRLKGRVRVKGYNCGAGLG
jgi:hypothetical protein